MGAVLGEIPAASAGMTDLLLRGCDGEGAGGAGFFCAGVAGLWSVNEGLGELFGAEVVGGGG